MSNLNYWRLNLHVTLSKNPGNKTNFETNLLCNLGYFRKSCNLSHGKSVLLVETVLAKTV